MLKMVGLFSSTKTPIYAAGIHMPNIKASTIIWTNYIGKIKITKVKSYQKATFQLTDFQSYEQTSATTNAADPYGFAKVCKISRK